MINRLALFLFSLLLVLGINLGTPSVAHAEELPLKIVDLRNLPVNGAAAIISASNTFAGGDTGYPSKAWRVTVYVVGTNSVFNVDYGSDLAPVALNGGTALTAGCLYTFTFSATSADTINFTCTTSTTIGRLVVEEIRGGVL